MTESVHATEQTEAVRRRTIAALKLMTEQSSGMDLPQPALEGFLRKLEDNTYKVLVVGEAKRGKSTFVNALVGRGILPTDVGVATSQVFHVRRAEREACRIRFEDGSQQEIGAVDLPRHGSQVQADAGDSPRLDQIIRWIEVDVAARFLPPNVTVLDTPGLGTLYASHARITHRFVPQADAVIFVLDSLSPISEPELQFVDAILSVTQNIFFIQTKIDQFRKEVWQDIQRRNQDLLRDRFQERLADVRVWPISSANLDKAAATGDDDYLIVSRHKELAPAMQSFLFRVSGWSRAAEAVVVAGHHHALVAKTLHARHQNLVEDSRQKRAQVQQAAARRRQQFESDWGDRGRKRRDLLDGIRKAAALAKQDFHQALQVNGSIELTHVARIDGLTTMEGAKRLGETLSESVVSAASGKWREVCFHFQANCIDKLRPFLNATEDLADPTDSDAGALAVRQRAPELNDDLWNRIKAARTEAMQAGGVAAIGGTLAGIVVATSWFPPLLLIGVAAAGIWGMTQGWKSGAIAQVNTAKQELRKHLGATLTQVRRHFFDVSAASGRSSMVDEHFGPLVRTLEDRISAIAEQELVAARAEDTRMADAENLDELQRKTAAEKIRQQSAEWEKVGRVIREIETELQRLNRATPTAAV